MRKIDFVKVVASGNDFVIIENLKSQISDLRLKKLAKEFCKRKFGIGADGLLVIESSLKANFKMRIFNPDGSEAEMCGNGARCVVLWATYQNAKTKKIKIETKSGIVEAEIQISNQQMVKIKMPQPKELKLDIPINIDKKTIKVNFVKVGVPQVVIFVKDIEKSDIQNLGKKIRYHQKFQPYGANVNFVKVLNKNSIHVRTYERGVEQETFSCGTGSVASSLITKNKEQRTKNQINVHTQCGVVKVYFDKDLKDVYLEGEAKIVYFGSIANT